MKKNNEKPWQHHLINGIRIVIVVSAVILFSKIWLIPMMLMDQPRSFDPGESLNQLFTDQYLGRMDVNNGITLSLRDVHSSPDETQAKDLFDYYVSNYTNEPIIFQNLLFGLELYEPDRNANTWTKIIPNFPMISPERVIKPNTQDDDSIFYSYYDQELPDQIRVCVYGTGQNTYKKYAGCFDLQRK